MQDIEDFEYKEEGVVNQTIGAMIALFVGLGVVALVVILVGVLGGKAVNVTQVSVDQIYDYQDSNIGDAAIEADVNGAIQNAFVSFGDAVSFLPIIVLALVFFLVLALLATGMRPFSGGGVGAI